MKVNIEVIIYEAGTANRIVKFETDEVEGLEIIGRNLPDILAEMNVVQGKVDEARAELEALKSKSSIDDLPF